MSSNNENEKSNEKNKEEIQNRFKKLCKTLDNLEKLLEDFPEITIKLF